MAAFFSRGGKSTRSSAKFAELQRKNDGWAIAELNEAL